VLVVPAVLALGLAGYLAVRLEELLEAGRMGELAASGNSPG
jgi:hypothetical protein